MVNHNDKRKTISIDLTPEARVVIEALREDSGIPNTEATKRILQWFAGLDRKLRLAILNKDIETQREMIRLVLADMAGDAAAKTEFGPLDTLTLDQLVSLQHKITDQMAKLGKTYQRELKKQAQSSRAG